jgi:hypothetical protein
VNIQKIERSSFLQDNFYIPIERDSGQYADEGPKMSFNDEESLKSEQQN